MSVPTLPSSLSIFWQDSERNAIGAGVQLSRQTAAAESRWRHQYTTQTLMKQRWASDERFRDEENLRSSNVSDAYFQTLRRNAKVGRNSRVTLREGRRLA